jgi:hypothetical protein
LFTVVMRFALPEPNSTVLKFDNVRVSPFTVLKTKPPELAFAWIVKPPVIATDTETPPLMSVKVACPQLVPPQNKLNPTLLALAAGAKAAIDRARAKRKMRIRIVLLLVKWAPREEGPTPRQ